MRVSTNQADVAINSRCERKEIVALKAKNLAVLSDSQPRNLDDLSVLFPAAKNFTTCGYRERKKTGALLAVK